jgi:hypothetical protein
MSVMTGPRTLQELARKALDIQAKQEPMEMMSWIGSNLALHATWLQ